MVENGKFFFLIINWADMDNRKLLKRLPSVETVLEDKTIAAFLNPFSRKGLTRLIRETIAVYRGSIMEGLTGGAIDEADFAASVISDVRSKAEALSAAGYRRVINAAGVIIHTNLGRALLREEVREEVDKAARGYIDLEVDLVTMNRTRREDRAAQLLSLLTGSEDAHIVNNNAAAVFLAVETLAGKGAVAVSRGELVEIGGSFRLPEILRKSAGRVIEIGTTNRTHIKDYARAVEEGADLLLKVHKSNFKLSGYTEEVSLAELVKLGKSKGVPVMYDQGGGLLFHVEMEGSAVEESIEEIVGTGADIITFSADKLMGGPQGGVILGRSDLVKSMRENHLARALRTDKMTLAGLQKVLTHYWSGKIECISVLEMATLTLGQVRDRAAELAGSLGKKIGDVARVETVEGESAIGGGTFPNNPLPTELIEINLAPGNAEKLARILRCSDPAVLVRVKGESIFVDLRTVQRAEEELLERTILEGIGKLSGGEDHDSR